MKTRFIIAALVFGASCAHARLGESLAQCVERYGQILKEEGSDRFFRHGGYDIAIAFHDGKADFIAYKPVGAGVISADERARLVFENTGFRLEKKDADSWVSEGKTFAMRCADSAMMIMTPDGWKKRLSDKIAGVLFSDGK